MKLYSELLLSLDGSELALQVLPYARWLTGSSPAGPVWGTGRAILGSVSNRVACYSKDPVLILPLNGTQPAAERGTQ